MKKSLSLKEKTAPADTKRDRKTKELKKPVQPTPANKGKGTQFFVSSKSEGEIYPTSVSYIGSNGGFNQDWPALLYSA